MTWTAWCYQAMLALSALAQNIKLRYTIDQLRTELGKTRPQLTVVRNDQDIAN
jgi:hypothetical protein